MKELDTTCSSNAEVVFNNLIRSGRNSAEYDFGRLTTRSSILTRKMDLKLDNIPTVCFVFQMLVLCYTIFVNIITHILNEDLVKLQIEVAKKNNEGTDNAPDTVYSCNISEEEVVRRMLTEYIKTSLPDYLVT